MQIGTQMGSMSNGCFRRVWLNHFDYLRTGLTL